MPKMYVAYHDSETLGLAQTGRWHEQMVATGDGDTFLIIASFYGVSRANQDATTHRINERLLNAAIGRAAQFISTPYVLCMDANVVPEKSPACALTTSTGIVADLFDDWDLRQPTYRRDGVYKGMEGPYTSRIDTMLLNAPARALVVKAEHEWGLPAIFDHVPLRLTLSLERCKQLVTMAGRPVGLNMERHYYKRRDKATAEEHEE